MSFEFDDIFELPFFLDKSSTSVLRRYIEAHNERYDDFTDRLNEIVESRQIDQAQGEELDRIGAAFGVLGRRRGRSDQEYRIYLKSLVQSFKGRGTVPGIISAVAAGLNTDEENVEVVEDFENLEYVIRLEDWPAHRGSTIEELAELADASVAQQIRTEYDVDEEETGVTDAVNTTVAERIEPEDVSISDAFTINDGLTEITESVTSDDLAEVNPNLITFAEEVSLDDLAEINPDLTTTDEQTGVGDEGVPRRRGHTDETGIADGRDVLPRDVNTARWETQDVDHVTEWSFFEWTELIDLKRNAADEAGVTDAMNVPPKDAVTTDEAAVTDAVEVRFNVTSTTDVAGAADAVFIDPNAATTSDTGGSDDAVTNITVERVGWGLEDWDTMNWTKEHN